MTSTAATAAAQALVDSMKANLEAGLVITVLYPVD